MSDLEDRLISLIEGGLLAVIFIMLVALGSILGLMIVELWRLILR